MEEEAREKEKRMVPPKTMNLKRKGKSRRKQPSESEKSEGYKSDEYIEKEVAEEERRKTTKKTGKAPRRQASPQPSESEDQPLLLFAFKDHIAHKIWNSNVRFF